MRYLTYDNNGQITGAYQQDVSPEHKLNFIEVSETDFKNWTNLEFKNGNLHVVQDQGKIDKRDKEANNAKITNQIFANDLSVIRWLAEKNQQEIQKYLDAQSALRGKLQALK